MDNQMVLLDDERAVLEVRSQVNQIQYLMKKVFKDGEHYGIIPGVNKPTLLQSGAEKICLMLKYVPHYSCQMTPIEGMKWHREYTVTCTLSNRNGEIVGEAIASCSTMESRYRWRKGFEDTGQPIPGDAKERKQEYSRQGLGMKKVGGQWKWVKYIDKQENPDVADTWNTVLQMAQKRAFVRATRSTAAVSDIFTQDVEELPVDMRVDEMPARQLPPPQQLPSQQPSDFEKEELRRLTQGVVSSGYDERTARGAVWNAFTTGGIEGARKYADGVMKSFVTEALDTSDIEF